jgi:hypothetical protein
MRTDYQFLVRDEKDVQIVGLREVKPTIKKLFEDGAKTVQHFNKLGFRRIFKRKDIVVKAKAENEIEEVKEDAIPKRKYNKKS